MALLKDILSSQMFNSDDFKKHPVEFLKEKSWKIPFENYSDIITSLSELAQNDSKKKTIANIVKKVSENDSTLRSALANTNQKYLAKEFAVLRSLVAKPEESVEVEEVGLTECIHEAVPTEGLLAEELKLNADEAKSYFASRFNYKDKNYVKAISLDKKSNNYGDDKLCSIKFTNGSLSGDATIIININESKFGKFIAKRMILKEIKHFKKELDKIIKRFKRAVGRESLTDAKNTVEFMIINNSGNVSKDEIINMLDREFEGFDVKNNIVG